MEKNNEVLMDQLSKISQDLANARMAKQEAEQQNSVLSGKNAKLEEQVRSLGAQVKKISESFAFEEARKTQEEVKELRSSLHEAQQRAKGLEQQLGDAQSRVAALEENVGVTEGENVKLSGRIEEQLDEIHAKDEALATIREQHTEQAALIEDLQERLETEIDKAAADSERRIKAIESKCGEKISSTEGKMHTLEGQRNGYMQKCKTLRKELQKMMKKFQGQDVKKLKMENEKLRSELDRRSKSLEDALSALDTFMHDNVGGRTRNRGGGGGVGVVGVGIGSSSEENLAVAAGGAGNHQLYTLQSEVKRLTAQLKNAEKRTPSAKKTSLVDGPESKEGWWCAGVASTGDTNACVLVAGEKIMELEDRSRSLQQQSSRATSSTGAAAATAAGESKNDVQGDEGVIDVVPPPVIRTPTASSARSFDDDDDDDDNNNNNASRKTPNRNKNIASPQTIEKDQAGGEAGGNESFATADDLP
eukprot:jgi/Bigna1/71581/fgenesh1_pg.16_\